MKGFIKKTPIRFVEIDGHVLQFADVLGATEGLKFATTEKPIRLYSEGMQAIMMKNAGAELVGNGFYRCVDEQARAAFETALRSLEFKRRWFRKSKG